MDQAHDSVSILDKPSFYVASRASNLDRPRMWVTQRDNHGHRILSTWIDISLQGDSLPLAELWERICVEIANCDCLVLYVEPEDFPLKGAFVEVGMALILKKPVRIVANGVQVDPHDCKPLGSWAKHPLVTFVPTVEEALAGFQLKGTTAEDLCPCPFCGGGAAVELHYDIWAVECESRACTNMARFSKEEAIAAWNQRAGTAMTALGAKVIRDAALKEAAEAMAPMLRSMISRGEAADTLLALRDQPAKPVQDALQAAESEIRKLRREKFELESQLRRQNAVSSDKGATATGFPQ